MVTRLWRLALVVADPSLDARGRALLKNVETKISVGAGDPGHYFHVGLSAVRCIDAALESAQVTNVERVLDFPSAYGRVLRFLVQRFAGASFAAGDLDHEAVGFCATMFDAAPVVSFRNLAEVRLGGKFDLIWCGSLLTHRGADRALELLTLFGSALARGGVLVFTTHGDYVAQRLTAGMGYEVPAQDARRILSGYERSGCGYADYPQQDGYGLSVMSPNWVREQLARVGGLREIYSGSKAWDAHQDVFGAIFEG